MPSLSKKLFLYALVMACGSNGMLHAGYFSNLFNRPNRQPWSNEKIAAVTFAGTTLGFGALWWRARRANQELEAHNSLHEDAITKISKQLRRESELAVNQAKEIKERELKQYLKSAQTQSDQKHQATLAQLRAQIATAQQQSQLCEANHKDYETIRERLSQLQERDQGHQATLEAMKDELKTKKNKILTLESNHEHEKALMLQMADKAQGTIEKLQEQLAKEQQQNAAHVEAHIEKHRKFMATHIKMKQLETANKRLNNDIWQCDTWSRTKPDIEALKKEVLFYRNWCRENHCVNQPDDITDMKQRLARYGEHHTGERCSAEQHQA